MSKSRELEIDKRVRIYGSIKEIDTAIELIERFYPNLKELDESRARIKLQSLVDTERIKVTILFDGNGVWSFDKVVRDINRVVKGGMEKMTDNLYKFLHLCCGSIAHYDKQGWISEYPTVTALREFFIRNEFGERVLDHIPHWKTDVKRIVEQTETILRIPKKNWV